MSNCNDCGAGRRYQGVLYPARLTCVCEVGETCHCGAGAAIVELSGRVRNSIEPTGKTFFCKRHKPDSFTLETAAGSTANDAPKRAGNVSPAWTAWWSRPPAGAVSRSRVECASCKNTHCLMDRKNHNGTHSECPKCKGAVYTHATDEQGEAA